MTRTRPHPSAYHAVLQHQRKAVSADPSHLFLTAYTARLDAATGELATSELAAFVTSQALITVRKDDGLDIGAAGRAAGHPWAGISRMPSCWKNSRLSALAQYSASMPSAMRRVSVPVKVISRPAASGEAPGKPPR